MDRTGSLPLWPLVTVIHGTPELAVQGHEACVVIIVVSTGTVMHTLNSIGATDTGSRQYRRPV